MFFQQDPIGLAGGLNLYGFAGGDPVNFSDPFGLKIEFKDEEAEGIYNNLKTVLEGAGKAGEALLGNLRWLEGSERLTVTIGYTNNKLTLGWMWLRHGVKSASWTRTNKELTQSDITVGPKQTYSVEMRLSHELGHAFFNLNHDPAGFDGDFRAASNDASLHWENVVRGILGCQSRPNHRLAGGYCR